MRFKLQTASLRETTLAEYATRFVFGGLVTVAATLIANKWGPLVGGFFLAFPGIFPAGVSLVEKHKIKREAISGQSGVISARGEASVEAAGAAAGTLGLASFGFVVWKKAGTHSLPVTLISAALAWTVVAIFAWLVRDKHSVLTRMFIRNRR